MENHDDFEVYYGNSQFIRVQIRKRTSLFLLARDKHDECLSQSFANDDAALQFAFELGSLGKFQRFCGNTLGKQFDRQCRSTTDKQEWRYVHAGFQP